MQITQENCNLGQAPAVARNAEDLHSTIIEVLVPGYESSDISVKMIDGALVVKAAAKKELGQGTFCRGFKNTMPIDTSEESRFDLNTPGKMVKLANGILTITLPINEKHHPVVLEVN